MKNEVNLSQARAMAAGEAARRQAGGSDGLVTLVRVYTKRLYVVKTGLCDDSVPREAAGRELIVGLR